MSISGHQLNQASNWSASVWVNSAEPPITMDADSCEPKANLQMIAAIQKVQSRRIEFSPTNDRAGNKKAAGRQPTDGLCR
jgi:hypothetical protein